MSYKQIALAAAHSGGLTATAAANLTYQGVADLCGVTIQPDGSSPADFFFVPIRQYLISTLKQEESVAALEADRIALETQIKKLIGYSDAKVTVVDGEIKVETINT